MNLTKTRDEINSFIVLDDPFFLNRSKKMILCSSFLFNDTIIYKKCLFDKNEAHHFIKLYKTNIQV